MLKQHGAQRAAVHSIDHFALHVPSITDADHFFRHFGLQVDAVDGTLELRAEDGHRWARVLPAPAKSLAYLSFNCFAEDFSEIEAQVLQAGAVLSPAGLGASDGFWFHDPDGNLIQVRVGPKTMPDSKPLVVAAGGAANVRGACMRSQVTPVRPRRMSHVLLFTQDTARAVNFYERALGLRLSDKSADVIAFTHAPHGSDHHLVAFVKSANKGWHHSSWDVSSVDDVGNGASQMAAAGYKDGWGTGRHVLGSNFFHYVRDPWGSFCEYSADMDYVSAGVQWPAGDFAPEDSLYQWGPDVPDYFVRNTETFGAS